MKAEVKNASDVGVAFHDLYAGMLYIYSTDLSTIYMKLGDNLYHISVVGYDTCFKRAFRLSVYKAKFSLFKGVLTLSQ